jgi:hypothetical protein
MLTIPLGMRSMFIAITLERSRASEKVAGDGLVTFGCAESLDGEAYQYTDASLARRIRHYQDSCGAVAG